MHHVSETEVRLLAPEDLVALLRAQPHLHREMREPSFFCSADWLEAVLTETPHEAIFVLTVFQNSRIIGVLPLERVRNRFGGSDLHYLGRRFDPDPLGFICPASRLEECVDKSLRFLHGRSDWDRVILAFLLPAEASLWDPSPVRQTVAPRLALAKNIDGVLSQFDKKTRYKVRSAVRRAEKAGAQIAISHTDDEKAKTLDSLFRLHRARSSSIGRTSTILNDRAQRFHHTVVRRCPQAHLFSLNMGNRPIAVIYGFLQNNYFAYYQVAHDPSYSDLSPGSVLLTHVIDWCCSKGLQKLDFLQGDERYKFRWASEVQPLARAMLVAHRPAIEFLTAAERIGAGAWHKLRTLLDR